VTQKVRPHYGVGNALVYTVVAIVAGLAATSWIEPLHGIAFALAAALLTVAFDLAASVGIIGQSRAHGDFEMSEVTIYMRSLPWLGAGAIVVAGAADGYRAGGFTVLAVFMGAFVVCQMLLLRLEDVEVRLRAERDRSATYLQMVGTMIVSLD